MELASQAKCRTPNSSPGMPLSTLPSKNRPMTLDRITAYFFGAVALVCFGAAGYLLTRWWMGQ